MLYFIRSSGRLLFQTPDLFTIVISMEVLEQLYSERQDALCKPESGGILLGGISSQDASIFVDSISLPTSSDKCLRYSFFRSYRHNHVAMKYWKTTGKTGTYLGLWHTHPENVPKPSQTDLSDWKNALRTDKFFTDNLLFLIVGTQCLGIWSGGRKQSTNLVGYFRWEDKIVEDSNSSNN